MKKILFTSLLLLLIACRKENAVETLQGSVLESFTTPVSSDGDTRMELGYEEQDNRWRVTKQWSVGDSLIGFTLDAGQYRYFTYRCTSIEGTLATWTRVKASSSAGYPRSDVSATLHMAFAPGVSASKFGENGTAAVNACSGAIASGSGEYDSTTGLLDIKFENRSAVICLIDPALSGVSSQVEIDSIEVTGIYAEASLKIVNDTLSLAVVGDDLGRSRIIPQDKSAGRFFIPVLPGTSLKDMSVRIAAAGSHYFYSVSSESTIEATTYRINGKTFNLMAAEYCIGTAAPVATSSVQEAFGAVNLAQEGATVTLYKDIAITEALEFTNAEASLSLDLNGHSLTASNTSTATPAIKMATEGSVLTVTDNSASGSGKIDQKYNGTACTVAVDAGTLNLTGGNICNSSGNGYGRQALDIGAGATVNISGGSVSGGRTIKLGPGGKDNLSVLNVTGGKIEGRYALAANADIYATIYVDDCSRVTISEGTIVSAKAPCVYVRADMSDVLVTLGSKGGTGIPYLYSSGNTKCINGGTESAFKQYCIYKSYWNKGVLSYPDQTYAEVETLSPSVTDKYGYKYGYFAKASSDASSQKVEDGDTSEWF